METRSPAQQGLTLLRLSRKHRRQFQERQPWPHVPTAAELAEPAPALLRAAAAYVTGWLFTSERVSFKRDAVLVGARDCPAALPAQIYDALPCAEFVTHLSVKRCTGPLFKDGGQLFCTVVLPSDLLPHLETALNDTEAGPDAVMSAIDEFMGHCRSHPDRFPEEFASTSGLVRMSYAPDIVETDLVSAEITEAEESFVSAADELSRTRVLAASCCISPEVAALGASALHDAGLIPLDETEDIIRAISGALLCGDPILPPAVHAAARAHFAKMGADGFFSGVPDHLPRRVEDWDDDNAGPFFDRTLPAAPALHDVEDRVDAAGEVLLRIARDYLPQLRERLIANHEAWVRRMDEDQDRGF